MGVSRFTALLAVVLLAGCATTPPPAAPTPTPPPSPTYGPPPSRALSLSVGQVEAGLGHRASVLTLTNRDTVPRKVTGYPDLKIRAGDGEPLSVLAWSATVTSGDQHTGAAIAVIPVPGEPEQKQPLETDLGTTDTVELSAWALGIGT